MTDEKLIKIGSPPKIPPEFFRWGFFILNFILLLFDALQAFLRPGFYNLCYLAIIFSLFQNLLLKKP